LPRFIYEPIRFFDFVDGIEQEQFLHVGVTLEDRRLVIGLLRRRIGSDLDDCGAVVRGSFFRDDEAFVDQLCDEVAYLRLIE